MFDALRVFEGVVVVVEDEVVLEHLGVYVVLAFVAFGPAGGCAGYGEGEVASGAGGAPRDDDGDVPLEAGVGAGEIRRVGPRLCCWVRSGRRGWL